MATADQTNLSDFIKSIHKKLREEAKILGTQQAWKNHCENEENLEKYAKAMQQLAVNHWDRNSKKDSKVISRVFWIYGACKEYFQDIDKYRDKEVKIAEKYLKFYESLTLKELLRNTDLKYKVLDVGSCYNPFKQFELFEVLSVDIAPANSDVLKSDFLNLNITSNLLIEDRVVKELPEGYFNVVIFSLLLEYLPTPELRLKSCLNAYTLLQPEGILVIITPDSNHVGSNAKIIKSWRYVLAKHGFIRIKYEKLHYLHCMVFRKALFKEVAQRWADVHASEGFFEQIYIPQDFKDSKNKENEMEQHKNERNNVEWSNETFLNSLMCSSLAE